MPGNTIEWRTRNQDGTDSVLYEQRSVSGAATSPYLRIEELRARLAGIDLQTPSGRGQAAAIAFKLAWLCLDLNQQYLRMLKEY